MSTIFQLTRNEPADKPLGQTPVSIRQLVTALLRKKPENRPADARSVAEGMKLLQQGKQWLPPGVTPTEAASGSKHTGEQTQEPQTLKLGEKPGRPASQGSVSPPKEKKKVPAAVWFLALLGLVLVFVLVYQFNEQQRVKEQRVQAEIEYELSMEEQRQEAERKAEVERQREEQARHAAEREAEEQRQREEQARHAAEREAEEQRQRENEVRLAAEREAEEQLKREEEARLALERQAMEERQRQIREWESRYGTKVVEVTNPATGRTWMDRNLGASRAATSSIDTQAYGDLYQWGRATDGHQKRNSGTTSSLSDSDTLGHGNFILINRVPYNWRSPHNDKMWQGVNGVNNPCPPGYRLPKEEEWEAERRSWSSNDASGAFASPLKLSVCGSRFGSSGSLHTLGLGGFYWSSTVHGSNSRLLFFDTNSAGIRSGSRAGGRAVRCLRDD